MEIVPKLLHTTTWNPCINCELSCGVSRWLNQSLFGISQNYLVRVTTNLRVCGALGAHDFFQDLQLVGETNILQ